MWLYGAMINRSFDASAFCEGAKVARQVVTDGLEKDSIEELRPLMSERVFMAHKRTKELYPNECLNYEIQDIEDAYITGSGLTYIGYPDNFFFYIDIFYSVDEIFQVREPPTFAGDPVGPLLHQRMEEPFEGMIRGYRFGQAARVFGAQEQGADWQIMDIL